MINYALLNFSARECYKLATLSRAKMSQYGDYSIHFMSDGARSAMVGVLTNRTLDGIVMTDRVSACGHNLIGAKVMIFMGSLYSKAYCGLQAEILTCGQSSLTRIFRR